ncbi:MAG: cysteine--tRNA ligase [Candidatus Lloydbacteria bacterium RIFCSPHIGHO2_01_FULL_41_20]|uniref:Cysteine--tRNA ligase n=1 Tax=Candidatus Lloydbacteria bacterium RIFCSPHIGHO2_01_FULL_41_20 TaxID=1798657 RepID=A0A1G2CQW4_9BACT|nr:MAG: cysteine--tRNA ligase [Candidatus Lloydbacteria bacterium RIFCSPHIGHO2_01_FULL_41_20]
MALRIYNTLSQKEELFTPQKDNLVSLYSCGPTVYGYVHIGNLRTQTFSDTLRRTLTYLGYGVTQVINITDVDDKTIKGSAMERLPLSEFTKKYETLFFRDTERMNILRPNITPRATEYISEMISLIERLIEKKLAYKADDGIYFDIAKSDEYGELAQLEKRTDTKSRITKDEYDKENANDFALWKFYREEDGDAVWPAPFGKGRPGWHIECSAMSMKNLGETIDIHTGGMDLIFPHHTNEIAQSEGVTGKKFVRYWMHSGFINMENEKMAKSIGNIITLDKIIEKGFDPLSYRYLLLGIHYRKQTNFSWEALEGARNALEKLYARFLELGNASGAINKQFKKKFTASLQNDLNTPIALSIIWEVLDSNLTKEDKKTTLLDFDKVLGLGLEKLTAIKIPMEVLELAGKRERARSSKNWALADEIRQEMEGLDYTVSDTDIGPQIRPKK